MKTTTSENLFDPEYFHIDHRLKGARLATFSRRLTAYGIDWFIIILCTEYLWIIIVLLVLLLSIKRRLFRTLALGRRAIRRNMMMAEQKLETMDIEQKLRRRFTRYMVMYLYILLYTPMVAAALIFVGLLIKLIFPQSFVETSETASAFFDMMFEPIEVLNDAMKLIGAFFGALVYFSVFNWKWAGQTPGKRIMEIKVVKLNGQPLTFWNSLERASGYTASASIFLIGFMQYFWEKNRQTTHDKISETIVLDTKHMPQHFTIPQHAEAEEEEILK